MRIVFWVRTGNKYGGLERYIVLFSKICSERGHEFFLLNEVENTSPYYLRRLQASGTSQVVIGESNTNPSEAFLNAFRRIKLIKPDVVQLHFINSLALVIAKLAGVKQIYQTYHSGIDHRISITTRGLRLFDNLLATRIVAISKRVKEDELRAGVDPRKIFVSYLGVSLDDYNQNLQLTGIPPIKWDDPQIKKIISIGRFFPEKGMRYVTQAAVNVVSIRKDIVWWLVGKEGPDSQICNEIIRSAYATDRIQVLGQREDIQALLRQAYIQVVGSVFEGLGLMAIEAAACGVPTIGTKIRGLDEAILDGETGILVKRSSAEALTNATLWLLDNPSQRQIMSHQASKYAHEYFDAKKHINCLISLFEKDHDGSISLETKG